jgi:hypothetical protein
MAHCLLIAGLCFVTAGAAAIAVSHALRWLADISERRRRSKAQPW